MRYGLIVLVLLLVGSVSAEYVVVGEQNTVVQREQSSPAGANIDYRLYEGYLPGALSYAYPRGSGVENAQWGCIGEAHHYCAGYCSQHSDLRHVGKIDECIVYVEDPNPPSLPAAQTDAGFYMRCTCKIIACGPFYIDGQYAGRSVEPECYTET